MNTRAWILVLSLLCAAPAARSENIEQVLHRSQQSRLESLPAAAEDIAATRALRESYGKLVALRRPAAHPELRIVEAGAIAETLQGRHLVLNVALGDLPEICRLFVLAHELGHVERQHWEARVALYRRHIPGEVLQAHTDAVAHVLGREASTQSHQHEFEADAYALHALLDLGYGHDELIEMFRRLGQHHTTATHPSTARRLMHLRMIEDERRLARASFDDEAPLSAAR